jgi:amino acid permease
MKEINQMLMVAILLVGTFMFTAYGGIGEHTQTNAENSTENSAPVINTDVAG